MAILIFETGQHKKKENMSLELVEYSPMRLQEGLEGFEFQVVQQLLDSDTEDPEIAAERRMLQQEIRALEQQLREAREQDRLVNEERERQQLQREIRDLQRQLEQARVYS